MSGEALRLAIGQEQLIRSRRFRIAARVQFSGSDGDWEEWLLTLIEETPTAAVAAASGLWLEVDEGDYTLWTPTLPQPGFVTSGLGELRHLVHQGRKFTVGERGSATVRAIEGDAGGDCVVGSAFNYVDLDGPMAKLSIEWDGAETELFLGQRVDEYELRRWHEAAGGKPLPRSTQFVRSNLATTRKPSEEAETSRAANIAIGVVGALFAALLIWMDNDGDDDCYQHYNEATKQWEMTCDDGIRSRSSRPFSGLGSK